LAAAAAMWCRWSAARRPERRLADFGNVFDSVLT
jgi:hypothetical protein